MMKIGSIELKNNIFLAPMAGVTDLAFRKICHSFGAGLSYTEMVSAKALSFSDKKTQRLMDTGSLPTALQLFGNDPAVFEKTVPEISENALFIDINMGCPAPKIVNNGEGAALMRDTEKAKRIIDAVCKRTQKPVTVKMRAGWDEESINAPVLAKIAQECGAAAVTVHGRTRQQFYSGSCDRGVIRAVKEAVTIPVIANGDVFCAEDAASLLKETNADAVMIGRGSRGNPWIFKQITELFEGGVKTFPTMSEKIETALYHIDLLCSLKGEYVGIREARKHAAWYTSGTRGAAALRGEINSAVTKRQMKEILLKLTEE